MKLGAVMLAYRNSRGLGVRDMAREVGISPATLNRVERNRNVDGRTMAKLFLWLIEASGVRAVKEKAG